MYEKFRNDIMLELAQDLGRETVLYVLNKIDVIAENYTINKMPTDLIVVGQDEFYEILKYYVAALACEGKSKGTVQGYFYTLKNFIDTIKMPIKDVKANTVRAYLFNYKLNHNISDRTLEHIRIIICSFFHWCAAEEYIDKDPCVKVGKIRYEKKERQALNQLELEYLRKACVNEKERCIVEVLYSTGCRVSELVGIKLADINENSLDVLGKGKKHRTVYLNAKAIVAIDDYVNSKKYPSEYLISSSRSGEKISTTAIQKEFRALVKRSGVKCTPHILRHTFATQAVKTCEIVKVQQFLGHSNVSTTMQYTHVDDSDLKMIHEKAII